MAVADDRVCQSLELGGADGPRVVEDPDQGGHVFLVLAAFAAASVLVVEPVEGRPDPIGDRVVVRDLHGRRQAGPFLTRQAAADRIAARWPRLRAVRRCSPAPRDPARRGAAHRPSGATATAIWAAARPSPAARPRIATGRSPRNRGAGRPRRPPPGSGAAGPPRTPQVVGPDRVARVLGRELSQHADPQPERGPLQGQASMPAEQVLERVLLRIRLVEQSGRLDRQLGRGPAGRASAPGRPIRAARGSRARRWCRAASAPTPRAGSPRSATLAATAGGTDPAAAWPPDRPPRTPTPNRRAGRSGRGRPMQRGTDLVDDLVQVGHASG